MVYGMCIGSKRDDRHVEMRGKKAGGVQKSLRLYVYAIHGRGGPDANVCVCMTRVSCMNVAWK